MTGSGNALAFLGREAKGAGNAVVGLAGNLLSGSMKLSDYSKSLETNTKILITKRGFEHINYVCSFHFFIVST